MRAAHPSPADEPPVPGLDMLTDGEAWPDAAPPVAAPRLIGDEPPPAEDGTRWYSVEQVAAILKISTPTVRRRIKQGGPAWPLPDGSSWPVRSERITRPQGSYFVVCLPDGLEAASTEDPRIPPDSPRDTPDVAPPSDERVNAQSGVTRAGDASDAPPDASEHASIAPGDASASALERLALELALKAELVGELRARLDRTTADLDASRREAEAVRAELTRAGVELDASRAEWEATRQGWDATLQAERERRLVAEAALVALTAREDGLAGSSREVAAREAGLESARPWWRRLRFWT